MHSRQKITVPARGVSAFFAAVPAALSASVAETPGQTVLPLPRSADRQHPVCCHTSSADRIFRRRRLLSGQRQSVLCRGEYSAFPDWEFSVVEGNIKFPNWELDKYRLHDGQASCQIGNLP